MEGFNVKWLLDEVHSEIPAAEIDLHNLLTATAPFVTPSTYEAPQHRSKRALPLAAIAAGAISVFGSGVALGTSDCGMAGIFGTCQARENDQAIDRLFDMSERFFSSVHHLKNGTDQMQDTQNATWKLI